MDAGSVYFRIWVGGVLMFTFVVLVSTNSVERLGRPLETSEGKELTQSNITFLLEDLSLTNGVLVAISADFLSQNPVRFQVWRPESLEDRKYKLVWDAHAYSPLNGIHTIYLRDLAGVDCPVVHQGDHMGLFAEEGPMPVAYSFMRHESPAALRDSLGAHQVRVVRGDTVKFDALSYPFRFSINAFVHTDPQYLGYRGRNGVTCPNISVEATPDKQTVPPTLPGENNLGGRGHTGPQGPPGPPGRPGLIYPVVGQPASASSTAPCGCGGNGSLLHNHIILAIFVWLTALTVLNLCCLVAYSCRNTRKAAAPPLAPPAPHNDQNLWVEKIRETVREFNGNAGGNLATAVAPVGHESKLRLDYE